MKWSTLATLLAAPLALAGSIDADVRVARRSERGSRVQVDTNVVIVTEVIIIWTNGGGGQPTQTKQEASSVAGGTAATHTVIVGGAGGLVYTPDSIQAAIGDMVIFTFMASNHTVTQSAFATPCDPLAGGMDSGFMPNANNSVVPAPQMAMQVSVATPLWFYCRQNGHCGKGMTFSINPTADKTQAMFEQMAIAQKGAGSTSAIVGGTAPPAAAASAAAPPPPPPAAAASAAPAAAAPPSVVNGQGSGGSGECACSCFCGVASFPSAVQGALGFGGMSGSMPMAAM